MRETIRDLFKIQLEKPQSDNKREHDEYFDGSKYEDGDVILFALIQDDGALPWQVNLTLSTLTERHFDKLIPLDKWDSKNTIPAFKIKK
jgi:hypothetical protein